MKKPNWLAPGVRVAWRENLWQTLTIATFLGLLSGFGEGLFDLAVKHYHAPAILAVTLLADLPFFLVLGLALWSLCRAFRRNLDPAVALFVLLWFLLYYVSPSGLVDRPFLIIASGAIALLATQT